MMITMKMAVRNIARRKVRSLITILGVAIGISAVVGVSSVAKGLQHDIRVAIGGSASLIVKSKTAPDPLSSALDQSVEEKVRRVPGVQRTVAVWFNNRVVTIGNRRTPIMIAAVEGGQYDFVVGSKVQPIRGRLPRDGEAALGSLVWNQMRPRVGDPVDLSGVRLRLAGEFRTSSQLANMCMITTLNSVKPLRGNGISCVFVQTRDPRRVKREIERRVPGVEAIETSKAVHNMVNSLRTVEVAGLVLSCIAGLVGGLGVANTMLMSVLERRREIGVMKAVGATKARVMKVFLMESLLISLAGGALGCLIGTAGTYALVQVIQKFKGKPITVCVTPDVILEGFLVAAGIGVLSGLYPAWKAAKVDPVKALRHE